MLNCKGEEKEQKKMKGKAPDGIRSENEEEQENRNLVLLYVKSLNS